MWTWPNGFRSGADPRSLIPKMKRAGDYGQFGSCHTFWHLKKEKLKVKGINWRSPSELNPNTCFD